jgi:hypothetical protein
MRITSDCRRILIMASPKDRDPRILDFDTVDACLRELQVLRHDLNASYVDIATGYRVTHSAPFDCYLCEAKPELASVVIP